MRVLHVALCEDGIERMRAALDPGITEAALWSILHQTNIESGGEYIETRLLSSGPRTNPWYQETSDRRIEAGDLVAVDCDLVGPGGYGADLCRTLLCGERSPTPEQHDLYGRARNQVEQHLALLRPGRSFREVTERAILHLKSRPDAWKRWFERCGVTVPELVAGPYFDHFFLSLQAAISGLGVALGPLCLVEDDVRDGRLATPFPNRLLEGPGFHVLVRASARGRHHRTFLEALVAEAGQGGFM